MAIIIHTKDFDDVPYRRLSFWALLAMQAMISPGLCSHPTEIVIMWMAGIRPGEDPYRIKIIIHMHVQCQ